MKTSPMQRSLKHFRDHGMIAEKVEHRLPIPNKFVTRDLFNFIDIIVVDVMDKRIIGCQTTTMANMAAHRDKILAIPEFQKWKDAGGIVLLHGWRKIGPRGERKTWQVAEETL